MRKKKVLLALLMTCIATTGVIALAGCSKSNKGGNTGGTDITDPDVPLAPGVDGECTHSGATHVARVDATCTTNGHEEYWYCGVCETAFSDAELTEEVTVTELTILAHHTPGELIEEVAATCAKPGIKEHYVCEECHVNLDEHGNQIYDLTLTKAHNITVHKEAVASTHEHEGNLEYWYCADCDVYFLDEALTNGTTLQGVTLPKNHTYKYHAAVDATCETAGNVEYWECTDCDGNFDAHGHEIENVVVAAKGHAVQLVAANAATCEHDGNVEYWHCAECGKNFADEACTQEITETVIVATGHHVTYVEAKAATCDKAGNIAHWHCADCGKNFADEDCTIELDSVLVDELGHAIHYVAAKAATCEEDGNIEYWYCDHEEGKYFADENCTQEITGSVVIAANGHNLTHVAAKAATCEEDGNVEYWYCADCGKYFANEACTEEIANVVIRAGHKLTYVEAKAPTCDEDGNVEYWYCSECGKYFADEACTEELANVTIYAIGHNFAEEWTYDKATRTYVRVCNNDEEHKDTQAAGVYEEFPYLADSAAELNEVIALGGYIKITADFEIGQVNVEDVTTVIDLNGHTLTGTQQFTFCVFSGDLTINNGIITSNNANGIAVYTFNDTKVSLKDVEITNVARGVYADDSEITIDGCSISATVIGITVVPYGSVWGEEVKYGSTLTVKNTTVNSENIGINIRSVKATLTNVTVNSAVSGIEMYRDTDIEMTRCTIVGTEYYAIAGNGALPITNKNCGINTNIVLNDCTLEGLYGIYHPQAGSTLTVNGGSITAALTGIEVRAGEVTLNNVEIVSKATEFVAEPNNSGSTVKGAAVAVSQHTTNEKIVVNVNGCSFEGIYAIYEKDLQNETARDVISITLGEGNTLNGCVYSENCENIVESHSHGEWIYNVETAQYERVCESCGVVETHAADGTEGLAYVVADAASLQAAIENGGYIVLAADIDAMITIAADKEVNLNLNGYTLSYNGKQVKKSGTIVNNGTLTLTGGGKVYNGVHQMAAIVNTGNATLNGVTLERVFVAENPDTTEKELNSYYVIDNAAGEMTLINVNVLTDPSDNNTSLIRNAGSDKVAIMTIESGYYYSRDKICVKNDDLGILTINGGTFHGENNQCVQNWSTATINGGEFYGDVTTAIWSNKFTSETVINGGTFIKNLRFIYRVDSDSQVGPVFKVANGIFVNDPVIQIVAGTDIGYTLAKTEGGEYTEYTLNIPTLATDTESEPA